MASRLDIFLKTVNDNANKKCTDLNNKAQNTYNKSVSIYQKKSSKDMKKRLSAEKVRIDSGVNNQITTYEAQKQTSLLKIKNDYIDKVFDELDSKITEFTNSDSYLEFLKKSALSLKEAVGENGKYYLRADDLKYSDELKKILGDVSISEDATIILGGIAATDSSAAIRADDTIDCRVSQQRTEFHKSVDFDNI